MPWEGDLPPSIVTSLSPYRTQLEATFSATTNSLELGRNRRNGRFSVQAE